MSRLRRVRRKWLQPARLFARSRARSRRRIDRFGGNSSLSHEAVMLSAELFLIKWKYPFRALWWRE